MNIKYKCILLFQETGLGGGGGKIHGNPLK